VINKCTKIVGDAKGDIEMADVLNHMTIDILAKSILDYDLASLDGKADKFYDNFKALVKFGWPKLLIFKFPFLFHVPLPFTSKIREFVNNHYNFFKQMTTERKAKPNGVPCILDTFIKANENSTPEEHLTEAEIFSNLHLLFIAGHDTTAISLAWQLLELARNPNIQDNLANEIKTVLGDKDPSIDDLETLTQLNNFTKEALRMHPPVFLSFPRYSTEDLWYNDKLIPKNSYISSSIYTVLHHPKYWDDPMKFNPDRWNSSKETSHHKWVYLPFSLGPRMCLGNIFALNEMRLFIITILRQFEIKPAKDHTFSDKRTSSYFNKLDTCWIRFVKK